MKNTISKEKELYINHINEAMKKMTRSELSEYFSMLKDFSSTNKLYEKIVEESWK